MAARAFRAVHGLITVAFLLAIVYVWWCALTGRRDRWLRVAVAALVAEGAFVTVNGGDCPLGGLQDRLGDPVPLFELVLSPTAAIAVPFPSSEPLRARASSCSRRPRLVPRVTGLSPDAMRAAGP